jgi:hypothetical protein
MKFAAIIGRKVGGTGVVGGEVSCSIAELLPKAFAARDAGKLGKVAVDRVWIATDIGIAKELRVADSKLED